MLEYQEETTYHLREVRFAYSGGTYTGRGTMTWDPGDGFTLEATVDRTGPPLTKKLEMFRFGVSPPSDFQAVKLRPSSHEWGVIPNVRIADHLELFDEKRLSFRASHALFATTRAGSWREDRYYGRAILRAPDVQLPDRGKVSTVLVGEELLTSSCSGLLEKNEEYTWRCWCTDNEYLHTDWALPSGQWSRRDAWDWGEAVALAVSLLSGRMIRLAERTVLRKRLEITERLCTCDPDALNILAPFDRHGFVDRKILVALTPRLVRNANARRIASLVLGQLADASRQESRQVQELLCATILEAILRTVRSQPFRSGDRGFNVKSALESFREEHFTDAWKGVCESASQAYKRLRHRNAHPDWVATSDGGMSTKQLEQSLDDMIQLARLYGYIVLAVAGIKGLKPVFPRPHREWGPAVTTERHAPPDAADTP